MMVARAVSAGIWKFSSEEQLVVVPAARFSPSQNTACFGGDFSSPQPAVKPTAAAAAAARNTKRFRTLLLRVAKGGFTSCMMMTTPARGPTLENEACTAPPLRAKHHGAGRHLPWTPPSLGHGAAQLRRSHGSRRQGRAAVRRRTHRHGHLQ